MPLGSLTYYFDDMQHLLTDAFTRLAETVSTRYGALRSWMRASRDSLAGHFDPLTARALDALVEGFSIHNSVDPRPTDREEVAAVVRAVVDRHH